jgi:DMSO reductase anchor subunit
VLLLASLSLWGGYTVLGWVLAWLVVVLAAVNLFFGFCAGCFAFYQLSRLGLIRRGPAHGS